VRKTIAFRHNHNDQEVSTKLMTLSHADTPTRRTPTRRYADTPIRFFPPRRYADTFPLRAFDAVFTGADENENDQNAQHFD
jgi:hypothetical protein